MPELITTTAAAAKTAMVAKAVACKTVAAVKGVKCYVVANQHFQYVK